LPAITVRGVGLVVNTRSACVPSATMSDAVAELAPNAWFVAFTVTVSLITVPLAVPATTCTTSVTVPLVPAGAEAPVHEIAPAEPTGGVVHVVPGGAEIDSNTVFGGVFSVSDGLLAVPPPTFVAVCVYVILFPAITGSGEATFVTVISP